MLCLDDQIQRLPERKKKKNIYKHGAVMYFLGTDLGRGD